MSITATWVVLAVIILRLLLRKTPTWINLVLWSAVAIRLIIPFSFESALSLIPNAQTVSSQIMLDKTPQIDSGFEVINNVINPIIQETVVTVPPGKGINAFKLFVLVFSKAWVVGIVAMLLYLAFSYFRLYRKVKVSLTLKDNVYLCDEITTPFILGVFKPKIFLPSNIKEEQINFVIEHENAHIKRKDHLIKLFSFLLLSVYWFNPIIWIAYILLCSDIEKACDEKVIGKLDIDGIKGYSNALLSCSTQRRLIMACPLAFGEIGVKERIKCVLNYKKPTFWVIVIAVILSVVTAVCFLTNPISKKGLEKDTYWWCNNYNASFYVDADSNISGILNTEKEEINFDVKVDSNNARFINTLTNEVIITAEIENRNGELTFKVKEDMIDLNTSELVFTNSVVSVRVDTNSDLILFFGNEAQIFKDFIDNAKFIQGPSDCLTDFTITYSDKEKTYTMLYHSDCGTFYIKETDQSFTLSEEEKTKINAELFKYSRYFSSQEEISSIESVISNAIISNNQSDKPTGLMCVESHIVLRQVSATPLMNSTFEVQKFYLLVLYQEFNVSSGDPVEVKRDFSPVILTLSFSKDGEYSLEEYLVLNSNDEIQQMFPDENSIYDAINKTEFLGQLEERNTQKVKERMDIVLHQNGHYLYEYDASVSFANYTSAQQLYIGCLNRNKMYINIIKHLPIFKFETKAQLDNFKSSFKDDLTFNHGYNEVPSFNEVSKKYDEDYFKEKTLFLVYVGAGSGSFRYGVNSVYNDGENFCIHIETTNNPEFCTDDMAGWFVTVGVDKNAVSNCVNFDADLDNF